MPRKRNGRKRAIEQQQTLDSIWDAENPRFALKWDDGGASFQRALERYRMSTNQEPMKRYHSFTHAFKVLTARCKSCGCAVAVLAISRATPWRTTGEAAKYAFWKRFTAPGQQETCPHLGKLPDPEHITDAIGRAMRTVAARLPVRSVREVPGALDPSVYFDGAATKFYVAVAPTDP